MSLEERFKKAIENNVLWLVKQCLDDGVDPTAYHNEAIRWAASNGHTEIVRLLLSDKRVDPTANHNQAIQLAACNGHTETVCLLLSDKRVRDKLSKEEKIKFQNMI